MINKLLLTLCSACLSFSLQAIQISEFQITGNDGIPCTLSGNVATLANTPGSEPFRISAPDTDSSFCNLEQVRKLKNFLALCNRLQMSLEDLYITDSTNTRCNLHGYRTTYPFAEGASPLTLKSNDTLTDGVQFDNIGVLLCMLGKKREAAM
jgi:hypothetical protein